MKAFSSLKLADTSGVLRYAQTTGDTRVEMSDTTPETQRNTFRPLYSSGVAFLCGHEGLISPCAVRCAATAMLRPRIDIVMTGQPALSSHQ